MDFGAAVRRLTLVALAGASLLICATPGIAQTSKPNIVVIMSDDVGWFNISAYNRGIMAGRTPNLDKLASEGLCYSPTIMPRLAARRDGPTSSPVSCRFVPE